MFFDNKIEYTVIEDIELEEMGEIPFHVLTQSDRWAAYAHFDAERNNMNIVYTATFTYYISQFLGGMGLSAGAEYQYFTERLDDYIFSIYENVINTYENNEDQVKEFYKQVFTIFNDKSVRTFERNIARHTIHLNDKNKAKLDSLEGDSIKEKLMNCDVHEDMISNKGDKSQIGIHLTFSEEEWFDSVEGESSTDKVLHLL